MARKTEKKQDTQTYKGTTPKGVFKYPRLNEPDTKFKDEGEYSVKLVLDEDAAEKLKAKLQPVWEAAIEKGKEEYNKLPVATRKKNEFKTVEYFQPIYDEETEEETGEYEFNFKMRASGVSRKTGKKWKRQPVLFDAKGNRLPNSLSVWGGTVGKVAFEAVPFFTVGVGAGISLRLNAVQIIELVSEGGGTADSYGFEEEEGFVANPSDFTDEEEAEEDTEEDEGEEDDEDF